MREGADADDAAAAATNPSTVIKYCLQQAFDLQADAQQTKIMSSGVSTMQKRSFHLDGGQNSRARRF